MNGFTAKALRKVFKAKTNVEGYRAFKKAVRHSDPLDRKKALQMARNIVRSGKTVHIGELPDVGQ